MITARGFVDTALRPTESGTDRRLEARSRTTQVSQNEPPPCATRTLSASPQGAGRGAAKSRERGSRMRARAAYRFGVRYPSQLDDVGGERLLPPLPELPFFAGSSPAVPYRNGGRATFCSAGLPALVDTRQRVIDGVPSRGVGDHVRSPEAVGQVRGAAGNASSAVPSVSSATEAAAM